MAAGLPGGDPSQEQAQELNLPVGLRFRPTNEQVIGIYLLNEATGGPSVIPGFKIPQLDVYGTEPWLLRPLANTRYSVAGEFYCFTRMKRSSAKDGRLQRKTPNGRWKANGSRRPVPEKNVRQPSIGSRMQLKFLWDDVDNVSYGGLPARDKKAKPTVWVMHEYRLPTSFWESTSADVGELVMCKISPTGSGVAIGVEAPEKPPLPCLLEDEAEGPPRAKYARTDDGSSGNEDSNNGALAMDMGGGDILTLSWEEILAMTSEGRERVGPYSDINNDDGDGMTGDYVNFFEFTFR